MRKVFYSAVITFTMIFSIRIVTITTPLNFYEQFALVGLFIDYTLARSKEL